MNDNMIKINVVEEDQREHLWAEKLEGNRAKVMNIPFMSRTVAFHDVVEYCPEHGTVMAVVGPSGLATAAAAYQGEKEEYKKLREALLPRGIMLEGMVAGLCSAAYPKSMSKKELEELIEENGAMLISDEEVKMGIRHQGNTKGCSCCGKNLGKKDG